MARSVREPFVPLQVPVLVHTTLGASLEILARAHSFADILRSIRQTLWPRALTGHNSHKHVEAQSCNMEASSAVKFDSIFNELTYFHVCHPGLLPCLGHDLFEGIVSTDLALYLNYLVIKKFRYVD